MWLLKKTIFLPAFDGNMIDQIGQVAGNQSDVTEQSGVALA
jgi:hypothetical protein